MQEVERPRGGIHTAQYKNRTEPITWNFRGNENVYSKKEPSLSYGEYHFQLNAEECVAWCGKEGEKGFKKNIQSYTFREQDRAMRKVLSVMGCSKPELMRIDFKFDWRKTQYKDLLKLNDLLIDCLVISQKINRASGSLDGTPHGRRDSSRLKGFCAKTKKFEVEYYDKTKQAPKTAFERGVTARLEFRKKQIYGGNPLLALISLKEAIENAAKYVEAAEEDRTNFIYELWAEGKYTMRTFAKFFDGREHHFFSVHHLEIFLEKVGCKNPKKFALKTQAELRKAGKPPLLIKKEFEKYVAMLVNELNEYIKNNKRESEFVHEAYGFFY